VDQIISDISLVLTDQPLTVTCSNDDHYEPGRCEWIQVKLTIGARFNESRVLLYAKPEELLAFAEQLRDAAHTVELARMQTEVAS